MSIFFVGVFIASSLEDKPSAAEMFIPDFAPPSTERIGPVNYG
jgi:hypothetical protein